jgi:tellurite resistance protein
MAGFLNNLSETYRRQMERHRNLPFVKAAMAASALVATADGNVSFSQRVRVDQILDVLEAVKTFDPHECVDLFVAYAEDILRQPKEGHAKAVKALDAVRGDAEKTDLLVRICLAIAEANGETSLADQIEIVTLCSLLEVDATDFGLYKDDLIRDLP